MAGSAEEVMRMPPVSLRAIRAVSEAFLLELAPKVLERPTRLDVAELVDEVLPRHGIHVSPASATELQDNEGLTQPDGTADVEIVVQNDQYEALELTGPASHRARATVCHEIGHAILHVPVIRRRRALPNGELLLRRVSTGLIKPYEHPEWQAWSFAGYILMPPRTLRMMPSRAANDVSRTYGVSVAFATSHLRRLRMPA
jgi:hypothetical protein